MPMPRRRLLAAAPLMIGAAIGVTIAAPRDARAGEADVGAATALFDEAVKLMDRGEWAEACPKLARSNEIAPSGGTLLALGECYVRIDKTASAWLAFREAASRAASAGKRDAEQAALARAARLKPRLSRLTIHESDAASMQGVEIRRDGAVVSPPEIDAAVPLDPGTHLVEARAPGHRRWSARVTLASSGEVDVTVPALDLDTPGAPAAAPPPPARPRDDTRPGSTQRVVGAVVAAAGLAMVGAGAVFGVMASSTNDDALSHCNTALDPPRCSPEGLALTDDARSQALLSTIFTAVGAAVTVGGAAIWLTAPSRGAGAGMAAAARF